VVQRFGMDVFSEGVVLTAFYMTANNKKTHAKENLVFALSFAEKDGKKIPDAKRIVILCTEQNYLQFKAFSVQGAGP